MTCLGTHRTSPAHAYGIRAQVLLHTAHRPYTSSMHTISHRLHINQKEKIETVSYLYYWLWTKRNIKYITTPPNANRNQTADKWKKKPKIACIGITRKLFEPTGATTIPTAATTKEANTKNKWKTFNNTSILQYITRQLYTEHEEHTQAFYCNIIQIEIFIIFAQYCKGNDNRKQTHGSIVASNRINSQPI